MSGIGTGGTISGVGKYLKEQNPAVRVVAADPEGSILSGGRPKPWAVEGIGEDYVPKTLNPQIVNEWIRVSDAESFAVARSMARTEGLLVGGSCGTAMAARSGCSSSVFDGFGLVPVFTDDPSPLASADLIDAGVDCRATPPRPCTVGKKRTARPTAEAGRAASLALIRVRLEPITGTSLLLC